MPLNFLVKSSASFLSLTKTIETKYSFLPLTLSVSSAYFWLTISSVTSSLTIPSKKAVRTIIRLASSIFSLVALDLAAFDLFALRSILFSKYTCFDKTSRTSLGIAEMSGTLLTSSPLNTSVSFLVSSDLRILTLLTSATTGSCLFLIKVTALIPPMIKIMQAAINNSILFFFLRRARNLFIDEFVEFI